MTTSYAYDGEGKRLQAVSGAATTNFLWDPNFALPQLALDRDGQNGLLRRHAHGADLISVTTPTATSYYHRDGLGSVTNVTSETGAEQWRYAYAPFGRSLMQLKLDPAAPDNPIRFAGEYLDPTGLYHLRARQYDPGTGRFLARDPLAPRLRQPFTSAYSYALNRPTTLTDPSGLDWCWKACGVVDAAGDAVEWTGERVSDSRLDALLGAGAVVCVATGGTGCLVLGTAALGLHVLGSAVDRGVVGPEPADWTGFAVDVGPAVLLGAAGRGATALVGNPYYVVSSVDRHIFRTGVALSEFTFGQFSIELAATLYGRGGEPSTSNGK